MSFMRHFKIAWAFRVCSVPGCQGKCVDAVDCNLAFAVRGVVALGTGVGGQGSSFAEKFVPWGHG